jgi:ABC-type maltose transport system permease subunit
MNCQTLGIVILGIGLTLGAGLFVAGCIVIDDWYSMFTVFPVLLAFIAVYGMHSTREGTEPGWIVFDTWVFFLFACFASIVGLPMVLYHVRELNPILGLILNCAGCATVFIAFALYYLMPSMPCHQEDGLLARYQY